MCAKCAITISSIIIPALSGIPNEHNINEYLQMTSTQISWLISFGDLMMPFGGIISAYISGLCFC